MWCYSSNQYNKEPFKRDKIDDLNIKMSFKALEFSGELFFIYLDILNSGSLKNQ